MSIDHIELARKHLWDYFHLHATQRLTTFNFYIVLSTLMITGLFTTFRENFDIFPVGPALGLLLVCLSFVFWKLDERNKGLIKHAEAALKVLEQQMKQDLSVSQADVVEIFTREALETEQLRKNKSSWPWKSFYSYSDCFRLIFLLFAVIGLLGSLVSVFHFIR